MGPTRQELSGESLKLQCRSYSTAHTGNGMGFRRYETIQTRTNKIP